MKNHIVIFLVLMTLVSLGSCKKKIYGCKSETALNHSTKATDDDGSCIEPKLTVFQSQFELEFSQDVLEIYRPLFFDGSKASSDDVIIFEYIDEKFGGIYFSPIWAAFPLLLDNKIYTASTNADLSEGYFQVKRPNGGTVFFAQPFTLFVRATLIKKELVKYAKENGIELNAILDDK